MFIQYFHKFFVFFAILLLATSSFADAYKWVDAEGGTNYTQKDPVDIPAELIKPPPPPTIDPILAQKEIDTLIEKQNVTHEENEKNSQLLTAEADDQKQKDEYCKINRQNLQLFQDNPGRRIVEPDGTVTHLTEERRQQQIVEIQKNIAKHCSE